MDERRIAVDEQAWLVYKTVAGSKSLV